MNHGGLYFLTKNINQKTASQYLHGILALLVRYGTAQMQCRITKVQANKKNLLIKGCDILCNQSSHNGKLPLCREAITLCYHELTCIAVSKDKWDRKEDTGKSMKHALYIMRYTKRHQQAEAMSNSKKIRLVALVVVDLYLSEGRQAKIL